MKDYKVCIIAKLSQALFQLKFFSNSVHHFKMVPWQWQSRSKVWVPVQNLVGGGGGKNVRKDLESVLQTGIIEFWEHGAILERNKDPARNVNVFIS